MFISLLFCSMKTLKMDLFNEPLKSSLNQIDNRTPAAT